MQQKKPQMVKGTIKEVQTDKDVLIVNQKVKNEFVETDQDEKVKGEGGEREIVRAKTVDAKLSDLKVGLRLAVTFTAEKKATEVLGLRAPKKGKEGDGR